MKTRYGVAPWVYEYPDTRRPSFPKLRGEHTTDVVIVGGGLTGCVTAYACAVAGLKALVVEAERVGQSAAGRSSGLLLPDPGPPFRDVVGAHGLRAGRHIFEHWRRASLDAAALVRRLGIRAGLEKADLVTIASSADETALQRESDARSAAGLDGRWLNARPAGDLARLNTAGALRLGDTWTLDPYRVCIGIAAAARKRGVVFAERTAVRKIRPSRDGVELTVDGGTVQAQTAVIATGSPTAEFKPLQRHFTTRHAYLAMTAPVPAPIRKQIAPADIVIRDTHVPPHCVRWTPDDRLVIAGADQDEVPARRRDAALVQRTGQLMYELLKLYPAIAGLAPQYGWDLAYGDTTDGLPYIGPHRNYPRHLFALGGRESLTGSFLAARLLARAASGAAAKGDDLFGWTR